MLNEYAIDVFGAAIGILILSLILVVVWSSTYVIEPSYQTTVLLVRQDINQESSGTSTQLPSDTATEMECGEPVDNQIIETELSNIGEGSNTSSIVNKSSSTESEPSTSNIMKPAEICDKEDLSDIDSTDSTTTCNIDKHDHKHSNPETLLQTVDNSTSSEVISNALADDRSNNIIPVAENISEVCPDSMVTSTNALTVAENIAEICPDSAENITEVCPDTSENVSEVSPDVAESIAEVCPDSIKIKLKFMDETQKQVYGKLTDDIGTFKRNHFAVQMSSNELVRLIFNGKILNEDTSTLGHCGLFDNCVVHCYISQQREPVNVQRTADQLEEGDIDLSSILSYLLTGLLASVWYFYYEYPEIFNTSALISLLFLTFLLLSSLYAFNNPRDIVEIFIERLFTRNIPEDHGNFAEGSEPEAIAQENENSEEVIIR